MLLDRVEPGTPLSRAGLSAEASLEAGAELLARLATTPPPPELPTLRDIVSAYLDSARQRAPRRRQQLGTGEDLVALGLDEAEALLGEDSTHALLHGDYNPGNILLSSDGTWRVIDPKPMRGDLEFDLWPLVVQLGDPLGRDRAHERLEAQLSRVAQIVGADVHRAARWAFARTALEVTWAVEDGRSPVTALAALAACQRVSGA
jgi:streptomycin 6-kinase